MQRTWTKVGVEFTQNKQERIAEAIKGLEWCPIPCEMGMMPGEAIKTAIRQLKIPRVSKVACSHELAPYGLVAIEGNYKNGRGRVYLVDSGVDITPIVLDFFPSSIKTADGETKVEWCDKEHFLGRATHIITGHTHSGVDVDVRHDVIPIPNDCIICDFCNDGIVEFPCPVVSGHALCPKCFKGIQKTAE